MMGAERSQLKNTDRLRNTLRVDLSLEELKMARNLWVANLALA